MSHDPEGYKIEFNARTNSITYQISRLFLNTTFQLREGNKIMVEHIDISTSMIQVQEYGCSKEFYKLLVGERNRKSRFYLKI